MNLSDTGQLIDRGLQSDRFRLVRFGIGGTAVSLGYTFTAVALVRWWPRLDPDSANAVSLVLWTIVSYAVHRNFTFRFSGQYRESVARYIFVSVLRLAVSVVVVGVTTRSLRSSYLVGLMANWVILPLFTYIVLKFWAFRRDPRIDDTEIASSNQVGQRAPNRAEPEEDLSPTKFELM